MECECNSYIINDESGLVFHNVSENITIQLVGITRLKCELFIRRNFYLNNNVIGIVNREIEIILPNDIYINNFIYIVTENSIEKFQSLRQQSVLEKLKSVFNYNKEILTISSKEYYE